VAGFGKLSSPPMNECRVCKYKSRNKQCDGLQVLNLCSLIFFCCCCCCCCCWQEGKHPVDAIQDVIKRAPFKDNADLVAVSFVCVCVFCLSLVHSLFAVAMFRDCCLFLFIRFAVVAQRSFCDNMLLCFLCALVVVRRSKPDSNPRTKIRSPLLSELARAVRSTSAFLTRST